jgi:CHAT domain-containing protein/tetratricopeptide (TPR) repeat protein
MASSRQTFLDKLSLHTLLRLFLALLFASFHVAVAQDATRKEEPFELKVGDSISRELSGGAADRFKVSASAKQYFHILVEQQGIVVALELFSPDGRSVVRIESVGGAHGPIHVSEIADAPGEYQLEVRSTEDWANPGRYEIRLQELRPSVPPDQARITGERTFAAGQNLISRAASQSGEEAKKSRREAIDKFKSAAEIARDLGDHHGEATNFYMMGMTHQRWLSESPEAKERMLEALAIAPRLAANDWRLEASLWNDLSVVYFSLYDEKNARAALEKALRIFETHHDRRGVASVHNNEALVHLRSGRGREALKALRVALPIRQAENDKDNELITLNNIGGAYEMLGEPREALTHYDQALQYWRQTSNKSRIPIGLNNVARVSDTLGLWGDAINYYQEALELVQKQGGRRNEAIFLYNIGDLYNRLNDPERSLNNYRAALKIHQEIKNPRDEANVLAHIAQVQVTIGQADIALENYDRALKIMETQESVDSRRVLVYTLIGIAAVYSNRDLPRALQYAEKARKLSQDVGDLKQEADALEKMGEAYHGLGDRVKALENFDRALMLRRSLADRASEASTLFHLAGLKRDLGKLSEAATLSEELLKIVELLRGNMVSQHLRTAYSAKTQNYYELYIDVKMRLYELGHDEIHRAEALTANERRRSRGLADSLAEARDHIRRGVSPELLTREQSNEERYRSKGLLKQQLLNEIAVNQKVLDRQPTQQQRQRVDELNQKLASVSRDINQLTIEYEDIQARIRLSNPRIAALTRPPTISLTEIQKQLLDINTIFLEYSLGEKRSYVWAITSGSIDSFELRGREEIEATAQRVAASVTARSRTEKNETWPQRNERIKAADAEYVRTSAALSKMVLEPVAHLLPEKKLVVVAADGALQTIPFQGLPLPQVTKSANQASIPLIYKHEVVMLPSATVLTLQRKELAKRTQARLSVAVLANPVFDAGDSRVGKVNVPNPGNGVARNNRQNSSSKRLSQAAVDSSSTLGVALRDVGLFAISELPYSLAEAQAIMNVVPKPQGKAWLDFDASRETARSPELSKYRIIHIATHGIMDLEHPELSGIVLSLVDRNGKRQDGYLLLHEIYNLNLPAELVVLSACQTGVGRQIKGEGLIALTRGFMFAGAKSVVGSLWKVDDRATAEMMSEFYKQMFVHKLKPVAALRQAQIRISQQKRWQNPSFWAGFYIQGEWN